MGRGAGSLKRNSDPRANDAEAGFDIAPDFERFNQMNDVFTRAFRDPSVQSAHTEAFFASYRMEAAPRRGEGFNQRDFALRNAAWLMSDLISDRSAAEGLREGFQSPIRCDAPVAQTRASLGDFSEAAGEVKKIARLFGADLVGITQRDERWHYSHRPDVRDMSQVPNDLDPDLGTVIVMGHSMDFGLTETYPSALAGAATGREYSHEAAIAMSVAAYLRNLGYKAVASMNDTALVIPYAIKAGLGEYGRNQMVLTPEFGPRVRFSKVFTEAPLGLDFPRKSGLTAYCEGCDVCATACPVKALPFGAPELGGANISAIKGVRKWTSDAEGCFGYWAKLKSDCAICMRVCPFNRSPAETRSVLGRLWLKLALNPRTQSLARKWAAKRARKRLRPRDWWADHSDI